MDDLTNFRITAPYRRTIDSPLARRLCTAAWAIPDDDGIGTDVDAALRTAAINAIVSHASDEESEVLERFGYTAAASRVRLLVDSDQARIHVLRRVELGCSITVSRKLVDERGEIALRTKDDPRAEAYVLRVELPSTVLGPLLDRLKARTRSEQGRAREDDRITFVNRSTGRVTWRELLDRIPETREHVLALLAERDAAESVDMAVAA